MLILISPGLIATRGAVADNTEHRHHALQVVLAPDVAFDLAVDGERISTRAAVIAPDTPHRLAAGDCLLLLVEPESHLAVDLRERWLVSATVRDLAEELAAEALRTLGERQLTTETLAGLLATLTPVRCFERHLEPRIERVLGWIDDTVRGGSWSDVSLAGALEVAHLSESRFLHLFSEQMGIPWRRYLLWRRLLGAARHVATGRSLTESAHFAAFSDAAHFSRTFRAMFGLAPTDVVKDSRFVQAPDGGDG